MDNNLNNLPDANIDEFIKIYPPLLNIVHNNSSNSNKFINFFSVKKSVKKEKEKATKEIDNNIQYYDDENKDNNNDIDNNKIKDIKNNNSENNDYYLINKGIELQSRNKKITPDIKNALSLFFIQSDLISKLTLYFKKYGISSNENESNKTSNITSNKTSNITGNKTNNKNSIVLKSKDILVENKIQNIIQKLVDNVRLEKYYRNDYIIKMNEIGKTCYFLLSGRLSILKPVLYKNIKISYENYFKYLLSLINNKEIELAKQIIEINRDFINIYSITNLLEIIKVYCLIKIRNNVKKLDETKTLNINEIENTLAKFNLTLSDYNLNKSEILFNINNIIEDNTLNSNLSSNKKVQEYFLKISSPTKEDLYMTKKYNYLFRNQNNESNIQSFRNNYVTLGKYEIFLNLEPGAFFGETALENENCKRNASIRVEEDCFIASLSNE